MSRATFNTASLFISCCSSVDVAVEVQQRVGASLQSKAWHIFVQHVNAVDGIKHERVNG